MLGVAKSVGNTMTLLSIVLMVFLCIPVAYEAIARSFGAPTIWVFETTLYAFIFLGFLGNSLAVQTGSHFRVMLLVQMFPGMKKYLDLIAQISTLIFAALVISSGVYFVWYNYTNNILSATLLEVPLWIPALAIPLGGLGLLLQTLVQLITGESVDDSHVIMGD